MKSINRLYLGSIIFKRDKRTDSTIRELSRFLLRWYRRIGLPSRDKNDLQNCRKYANKKL